MASVVTPRTTPATLRTAGRWLAASATRWRAGPRLPAPAAARSRRGRRPRSPAVRWRSPGGARPPPRWPSAPAPRRARRPVPGSGRARSRRPRWRTRDAPSRVKGRSITSPTRGTRRPSASRPRSATPSQNRRSWGRWSRLSRERGEEYREAEAEHEAGNDHVGTPPARARRAAGHHHRDHRDDAGGQARDQSAQEGDQQELAHRATLAGRARLRTSGRRAPPPPGTQQTGRR